VECSSRESAYLALARVYLAQLQYPQALQWFTALLRSAEQVSRLGSMISILALQASGATQEALHILLRLLTLAEPEGYIRVFLDAGEPMHQALQAFLATEHMQKQDVSPALVSYAQTLLDAFASEQHQAATEKAIPFVSTSLSHTPSQAVPPTA
jgi:LuxR family transcriptional regulator, maltose regulon positive regulatory protein